MLKEDHGHVPTVDHGRIEVDNRDVRVRINSAMATALRCSCVTPYVGLERVRKALAPFHIPIPGVNFLEGEEGEHVFEVIQFGPKIGQHENGQIITKDEVKYEIIFSWFNHGDGCMCRAKIREVGEEVE